MAERDELDQLLDVGLASYSECEPLAGIEERVLRRVTAQKRRPWLWWCAAAVPAAACVLLMLSTSAPVEPILVAMPAAPPAPAVVMARKPAARVARTTRVRMVKRDIFPSMTPLTGEERRWIEVAAAAPEAMRVDPITAIEIEPIQIKPLETSGTN